MWNNNDGGKVLIINDFFWIAHVLYIIATDMQYLFIQVNIKV